MQDSPKNIDVERLQDAWEQIKRFEDYSNNTELYFYIRAVNDAMTAIGDPTPAMLESLTDDQVKMVLAVSEVNSRLQQARDEGKLPADLF